MLGFGRKGGRGRKRGGGWWEGVVLPAVGGHATGVEGSAAEVG